jgi:hypothetical protein
MSQLSKTMDCEKCAASASRSGRSNGATTRQSGSALTIRAPGQAARMALIPSMAARISAILNSSARLNSCGAKSPACPPAQAKYDGSLTGVK